MMSRLSPEVGRNQWKVRGCRLVSVWPVASFHSESPATRSGMSVGLRLGISPPLGDNGPSAAPWPRVTKDRSCFVQHNSDRLTRLLSPRGEARMNGFESGDKR